MPHVDASAQAMFKPKVGDSVQFYHAPCGPQKNWDPPRMTKVTRIDRQVVVLEFTDRTGARPHAITHKRWDDDARWCPAERFWKLWY